MSDAGTGVTLFRSDGEAVNPIDAEDLMQLMKMWFDKNPRYDSHQGKGLCVSGYGVSGSHRMSS